MHMLKVSTCLRLSAIIRFTLTYLRFSLHRPLLTHSNNALVFVLVVICVSLHALYHSRMQVTVLLPFTANT
jgi:hypothetical protein